MLVTIGVPPGKLWVFLPETLVSIIQEHCFPKKAFRR